MIRAIIIEDEIHSQEVLLQLLRDHCSDVDVVGTASNLTSARELINEEKPQLIFLDVELGQESSLDLFKSFPNPPFDVIFTTGHKDYALDAIKFSCLDYLLKPIDIRELQKAVKKREHKIDRTTERLIQNMVHNLSFETIQKQIAIPNVSGFEFVRVDDIVMAKADGNYSQIFTLKNDITSSRTLGEFESLLPRDTFFRSHKSFLINWSHIEKYDRQDNIIFMKGGLTADLALRRKEEFMNYIQRSGRH